MCLLIQTSIGDYRQKVLEELKSNLGDRLKVLSGETYFEESTKTRVHLGNSLEIVPNIFLLGRKLLYQRKVMYRGIKADRLILEMNPRIINVWLLLIIRRLIGKKTVLWGHAWPRSGAKSKSDKLRNVLRKMGSSIVVYTNTQKNELQKKMPRKDILVAPNSLYSKQSMYVANRNTKDFIYVGRLVSSKKPLLMIKAFDHFVKANSNNSNLIVVGDGPEKLEIERFIVENNLQERILLMGHISDIERLRELYSTCVASISPGYVGLSITQSFAFGTPMIISENEPHSPEIEAAIIGENSFFFETNSEISLSKLIGELYRDRDKLAKQANRIVEHCKNNYSAELMSERLLEAFERCRA